MHSRTTAREILDDFAGERLDYWVTGYGTGGTLKGVARVLRQGAARDQDRRLRAGRRASCSAAATAQQRNADGSAGRRPPGLQAAPDAGLDARTSSPSSPATRSTCRLDRPASCRSPAPEAHAAAARSWRRRKASSSASPPARPSPARCRSRGRRRRARPSCACCPTPASATLDAAVRRHPGRHERGGAGRSRARRPAASSRRPETAPAIRACPILRRRHPGACPPGSSSQLAPAFAALWIPATSAGMTVVFAARVRFKSERLCSRPLSHRIALEAARGYCARPPQAPADGGRAPPRARPAADGRPGP